jgi:glycosyltransferase involved in cell wall biosynthesis
MRIALISHTHFYWTGLYARYFLAQGHDVRVISFSQEPLEGVPVDYIGSGTPSRRKALHYFAGVPALRSRLRAFAPDVAFATYLSSNGLLTALCHSGPLVVSAHGSDVLAGPGARWASARMIRFTCRRADVVHAVSQHLVDALGRLRVPADPIHCFPIGVDADWYVPPAEGRRADLPPRVVCTRHQESVYANETIVEALALLRADALDVRATLLGGGALLEERRAQIRELGLEDVVDLPGHQPPELVRRALQTASVYVSASTSDGASSSLLEAMACGLFPVVSAIPANLAWIEDGATGLLFEPGDTRGLAEALRRAALDADLRASAALRNRALVLREGNLTRNLSRMEALLERATEMHRGPARRNRSVSERRVSS